jgi:AraC family transcriptional regulator of adaptative response / DNA-3-methyladenine glycosylase II
LNAAIDCEIEEPGLDGEICERARQARDPRFDGRFFIGVLTTGVYCRPICPVRPPKAVNVRFFPSAAAAAGAGFRPCLRCRPESSPGTAAWHGTGASVARALRLIDEGALDHASVEDLAARIGMGARHLSRLFLRHVGATPIRVAQTRRLHLAKKLLDETDLPVTQIAYAAGFSSVRRFNEVVGATYQRSPTAIRKKATRSDARANLRLELAYRPPLAWQHLRDFLAARALAGVEDVSGDVYQRTIDVAGRLGRIAVRPILETHRLELIVDFPDVSTIPLIVSRVRRLFDLDADPLTIEQDLAADAALAHRIQLVPGLRVPGSWDGFEVAVRGILGQAVSVPAARTLTGRLAHRFGERLANSSDEREAFAFPTPKALLDGDWSGLGVTEARALAIRALARKILEGQIDFDTSHDLESFSSRLREIPGIGPWTAEYIALRAGGYPDAFPAGDLGLLRGASRCLSRNAAVFTQATLTRRAERWRPWRGYAAMHLWTAYAEIRRAHAR